MNIEIVPFRLEGCQCRLKFDPKEVQSALDAELRKRVNKNAKFLDTLEGELSITGAFTEIDEGNFALHFMLAFLGKAWIAGQIQVKHNGNALIDEPFRISKTFSAFTGGRSQLNGDAKYLAGDIVKRTVKALKRAV
ncbi:MAG: hypothetical protein H6822_09215 [Planctomycetaceae bacterium]|nr:hypothetical protein [Planctomycetales bacterium]MCB9922350.1 hypothetical protein [Planctomycetaceae bacterium]